MDGHVGITNRTKKLKQANKCWAITALQSILATDLLLQRLLEVGGRNSAIAHAMTELASNVPTKGDVACWKRHNMRGINTKVNQHNQTTTIQQMVAPPRSKAKCRTVSTVELTLVAKKFPKDIAKIEGIAQEIAQGE